MYFSHKHSTLCYYLLQSYMIGIWISAVNGTAALRRANRADRSASVNRGTHADVIVYILAH